MKVLDLFCGLKGWSASFADNGWEVVTLDIDPMFEPDLVMDIMDYSPGLPHSSYDLVLASPPCEGFSVMNIGKNWTGPNDPYPHQPKTPLALRSTEMVGHLRRVIQAINPRFFIIENPRAKLRKLPVVEDLDRKTVWYCQYGLPYAKPTDLFGLFPSSFVAKECYNGSPDHNAAPRGSTTGTQGAMTSAEKAKVPYALSDAIRVACERDLRASV